MALFSRKNETKKTVKTKAKVTSATPTSARNLSAVLLSPRVTEKAMRQGEKNVYTFEVARSADKRAVAAAVQQFFGVTPVKINIVNKTPRQYKSRARGRMALAHGMKKAYVYLKEGDSISLI